MDTEKKLAINKYEKEHDLVIEDEDIDSQINDNWKDLETESNGEADLNIGSEIYPVKQITIEKGFYTVFELKRKYDKSTPQIILDSEFQRKDVWSLQQKRELVESVIMGLPLPIFYFNADKDGRLIVIDGRQRLTALFEFIDEKFKLDKLQIIKGYNNCKFSALPPILQTKIEDYQIFSHVIQPPTADKIKFDIFDRVNRAGTQLNKQEIRNALYQGKSTKLLHELSLSQEFELATEGSFKKDKRMKDKYTILRFIAFYLYFNDRLYKDGKKYQYSKDLDEFLGITMEYLNNASLEEVESIKEITIKSLKMVSEYLGENAFRLVNINEDGSITRYAINIPIFESIMFSMTLLNDNVKCNPKEIKKLYDDMKLDMNFRATLRNNRDNLQKINERFSYIYRIIGEIND